MLVEVVSHESNEFLIVSSNLFIRKVTAGGPTMLHVGERNGAGGGVVGNQVVEDLGRE